MALFERNDFAHPSDDVGIMMDALGRGLVVWTAMQLMDRSTVTVLEAAAAFNTTPAVIVEAVDEASWIFVMGPEDDHSKQTLELDGD